MSWLRLLALPLCVALLARSAGAQEPAAEPEDGEEAGDPDAPAPAPEPQPKRGITEPEDDDGPEPPLVVPAPDLLSGHLSLSPSVGVALPFGALEVDAPQTDAMGAGWAFGLEAAYGLSRTVAVGAWGQHLRLGEGDQCRGCDTQSTAFGAFVRYHLVQGVRFDPWMSAGLGYRMTKISGGTQDVTYSGIEWLRLAVGGDWYAFDKVGFGPYLELDMGYFSDRSAGEFGKAAQHWTFLTGARVTLDLPGK
ncbi:MAG: hypothetical protein U0263_31520 [Polyangiaceae bacterium]